MAEVNDLEGWEVPVEERLVACAQVSELQCGICLDLLSDPCQCINGHLFCMTCILECIERKAECPQCRCQLSESSLSKSLFVRKYIDELLVHCRFFYVQPFEDVTISSAVSSLSDEEKNSDGAAPPPEAVRIVVRKTSGALPPLKGMAVAVLGSGGMSQSCTDVRSVLVGGRSTANLRSSSSEIIAQKRESTTESCFQFDPRGCPEQLKHSELLAHELHCGFAFVPCRHRGSGANEALEHFVRRNQLEQHLLLCPWRPLPCSFCAILQPCHRIQEHEAECDARPVPCQQCRAPVKKAQAEWHLEEECLESVVECPFSTEGCAARMRRRQVEEHVAESMGKHLLLMQSRSAAQRKLLVTQAATIASLEAECKNLKQNILLIPTDHREMTYRAKWEVERYSQKTLLGFIQSPRFVFSGITWYMGIYPNHGNASSHISLYLFVAKSDHPTAAVHVAYDFVVQNQNIAKSLRLKHICRFPLVSGDGWGSNEALEKRFLTEDAGFLTGDRLTIEFEAKIRSLRVL